MFKRALLLILVIVVLTVAYNAYVNSRVRVVMQTVAVRDLPEAFVDFKILQLTDLHGQRLGDGQERLLDAIHSARPDLIAITGDMVEGRDTHEPLLEIIEGIPESTRVFITNGNSDEVFNTYTGELTPLGQELQDRGVSVLNAVHSVKRGKDTLWVTEFYTLEGLKLRIEHGRKKLQGMQDADQARQLKLRQKFLVAQKEAIDQMQPADVKLALTHYPKTEQLLQQDEYPKYDLILAGHYHGGQVRIPFCGALYIPRATGGSWLPDQSLVSGLNSWNGHNQYVSRGLGASSTVRIIGRPFKIPRIRLFNPPEINLITLMRQD